MNLLQWLFLAMFALYALPWLTALAVVRRTASKRAYLVYYRHFVLINILLSTLVVGSRLIFVHPQALTQMAPALSIVESEYGALLITLAALTVFTALQSGSLKLAPALIWSPLLIISALLHIGEALQAHTLMPGILVLHSINDLVVAGTLIALGLWVYRKERRIITCFADSSTEKELIS